MIGLRAKTGRAVRSYEGLNACGDAVLVLREQGAWLFCVVDGLGHGPDAEKSANRAIAAVRASSGLSLQEVFNAADRALVGQRGAVMSLLRQQGNAASFMGVGNVDVFGPKGVSRPISTAGVVGRGLRPLRQFALPLEAGQRWVLASDGLRARDMTRALEAAAPLSPTAAAAKLLELAGRPDDDASVLVMDFVAAAHQQSFPVQVRPDAVGAGLQLKAIALSYGWAAKEADALSLLIIELCGNAVRHGGGGVCHVALDADGVELTVEDKGPGMPAWVLARHAAGTSVEGAPERSIDGGPQALINRQASGLGAGLDAARRLADHLWFEPLSPRGCRVFATRERAAH